MSSNCKIQKILFIYPRVNCPVHVAPVGLGYLAASVKDVCEVKFYDLSIEGNNCISLNKESNLYDYGLAPEKFKDYIEREKPELIGISCMFSNQIKDAIHLCKLAKSINPEIHTVLGGGHPSFLARPLLEKNSEIDFILLSESDESFPELIRNIHNCSQIDGLAYRKDSQIIVNPKTHFIQNLDGLPFPDRDIFPLEKYFQINRPMSAVSNFYYPYHARNLTILTSRGCPYSCINCSSSKFWGYNYRFRSVSNILKELQYLKEKYRIQEVQFIDDNLTVNKKRAKELFKAMIDLKMNLKWSVPNGVQINTLDDEMMELMKESGCYEVYLPIESGSQEVLDHIIKKPLNLNFVPSIIKKLKSLKMRTHAYFIIGFPSETKEQIKKTVRFAQSLNLDLPFVFCATPLIGSPLYDECLEKGYIAPDYNSEKGDYFISQLTTKEFNPSFVNEILSSHYRWLFLKLIFRNPVCIYTLIKRITLIHLKKFLTRVKFLFA